MRRVPTQTEVDVREQPHRFNVPAGQDSTLGRTSSSRRVENICRRVWADALQLDGN